MNTSLKVELKIPPDRLEKIQRVVEYTGYSEEEVIQALLAIYFRLTEQETAQMGLTEIVQTVRIAVEDLDLVP
jgi:hypothetical protein